MEATTTNIASSPEFAFVRVREDYATVRTARRAYYIHLGLNLWSVRYRVINPKTGLSWQGIKFDRKLQGTHHQLFADWARVTSAAMGPVAEGVRAEFPAGCRLIDVGYPTLEAAVEAVRQRGV